MIFYDRLSQLMKEKNVTRKKMCDDIKVPYNTLNSMIKRQSSKISYDIAEKIADYFGVTTDYLLGRTNEPNTRRANEADMDREWGLGSSQMEVGATEKDMLNKFRMLENDQQNRIRHLIEYDYDNCVKKLNKKSSS
ncbi:MAG: helix-turn-helix domain-containing protein [Candidatus Fimivivens sp.]